MSSQTEITQFFPNRKKRDEIKPVNQVDKTLTDVVSDKIEVGSGQRLVLKRKISWDTDSELPKKRLVTPHNPKSTPKFTTLRISAKKARSKSAEKSSARKKLFAGRPRDLNDRLDQQVDSNSEQSQLELVDHNLGSPSVPEPLDESPVEPTQVTDTQTTKVVVKEEPGSKEILTSQPSKSISDGDQLVPQSPAQEIKPKTGDDPVETVSSQEPQPSTSKQSCLRGELGLSEIRAKLKGSSRLDKIRDAVNRINKGLDKLDDIRAKKDRKVPTLSYFDTIEYDVPASPVKNWFKVEPYKHVVPPKSPSKLQESVFKCPTPTKLREAAFKSPGKLPLPGARKPYVSPRKLLDEMRSKEVKPPSAAYQQECALLAQAGQPCLVLPHSYRTIGELFKSVDIVISLMYNRKETVHFSKLKPSVQELSRTRLTEHHLGQMLTVFPNSFDLSYQKVREPGKTSLKNELIIAPVLKDGEKMTPLVQLERQRIFYQRLLDIVKNHHESFLLNMDPPLVVDKNKLSRWHPAFELDSLPDIEPSGLPKQPTAENVTSAKMLLGKARDMFMVNPRMEKALEKLSQSEHMTNSDGKPSAASAVSNYAKALQGIPKSILEKVRARQAAKAVEMLTMDPQKIKQDVIISRLPELARILRNMFVTERKNVMDKSKILDKLVFSYRENLSTNEMDRHLSLLVEKTEPWLSIHKDHNVTYIRMDKSMEMSQVYNAINSSQSTT